VKQTDPIEKLCRQFSAPRVKLALEKYQKVLQLQNVLSRKTADGDRLVHAGVTQKELWEQTLRSYQSEIDPWSRESSTRSSTRKA